MACTSVYRDILALSPAKTVRPRQPKGGPNTSRDVPVIHPVPSKCRLFHYSVLPGPGKIMGPSNKKNFFLPKVLMIPQEDKNHVRSKNVL